MPVITADLLEDTLHRGAVSLFAGVILLVSGIALAAVTPDDAPWIGSWLNGVFRGERRLGGILIALGVIGLCWVMVVLVRSGGIPQSNRRPRPSTETSEESSGWSEERRKALAQRFFNPPHRPKPDWGETLRGLGLFAAVATTVWYLAGGAGVGDYELGWLRDGFDAYGWGVLVLGGTIAAWALLVSVVSQELSDRHPSMTKLLEWAYSAALWSLRQTGLVIGATVLAVLTGVGVRAG